MDQAAMLKKMVEQKKRDRYTKIEKKRHVDQRVIGIASGKGGVGKTALAVNLGVGFAMKGKKVLVFDADLGLSNVNILFGVVPKYNLLDVFRRQRILEEVIFETSYGVDIISGGTGLWELTNLTYEEKMFFIDGLSRLRDYDIIIIDAGAGISENVLSFLRLSDKLLVVTTPEPTALTDAYGMTKAIFMNDERASVELVVNRCVSERQAINVVNKISKIAEKYLEKDIGYAGPIFEDRAVVEALYKRMPYLVYNRNATSSACLIKILDRLDREIKNEKLEWVDAKKSKKSFLEKLANFF